MCGVGGRERCVWCGREGEVCVVLEGGRGICGMEGGKVCGVGGRGGVWEGGEVCS